MTLENVILFIIMALVLVGIPVFLARRSGKNPMELFFGSRVNNTAFGKKEESDKKTEGQEKRKSGKARGGKPQRNSSKNDLYQFISSMLSFARRNHFMMIVPGTVQSGENVAVLTGILITRSRVIGINCFGFGGSVTARPGDEPWIQKINGEQQEIANAVVRNRQQEEILQAVMKDAGLENVPMEIVGVFTTPGVSLVSMAGMKCYTAEGVVSYLESKQIMKDCGVDPKEVGNKLNGYVKRK